MMTTTRERVEPALIVQWRILSGKHGKNLNMGVSVLLLCANAEAALRLACLRGCLDV